MYMFGLVFSGGRVVFKGFRWSRRRVVVAVVAAVAVVAVGASSASAISPSDPEWDERARMYQRFTELANPSDFEPRDLKVAAPSSVIDATAPSAPGGVDNDAVRAARAQSVNSWRPNPQAWTDAKSRLAAGSGLTTAEIDSTARWKPRILKGIGMGIIGGLTLAPELSLILRDDVLVPQLGLQDTLAEDVYCLREGNFATDFFGSIVGADCAAWRMAQDYNEPFQRTAEGVTGSMCHAGYCYTILGIKSEWDVRVEQNVAYKTGRRNMYVCRIQTGDRTAAGSPVAQVAFLTDTGVHWYSPGSGGGHIWEWCRDQGTTNAFAEISTAHYGGGTIFPTPVGARLVIGSTVVDELEPATDDGSQWVTRVRCSDGSTRDAVSEAFVAAAGADAPEIPSVTLDGCQPVDVEVGIKAENAEFHSGTSLGDFSQGRSLVGSEAVDPAVQDWMTTYPQCWDGSCSLDLKKVIGGSMEIDCFEAPDQCASWQEDTATGTATYRCYYASTLVDLAECNVYGRTFVREAVQQGTGYTDPKTGETVKTGTGTTTTTNPGAATVSMNQSARSADNARECWPTGWGVLNPFEWVYLPVKCVIEWAFVPRTAKVTQVQTQIRLAAINSKPGLFATRVGEWQTIAVAGDTGCSGPLVAFNVLGMDYSGYPLSACEAPASTFAMMSRIALTIVFAFGALYAITRYVGGVFGFRGVGSSEST